MSKLTSKGRSKLPNSDFAVAGRKYPVNDRNHAKAALSMVSRYGDAEEKRAVRNKVARKYPGMGKGK